MSKNLCLCGCGMEVKEGNKYITHHNFKGGFWKGKKRPNLWNGERKGYKPRITEKLLNALEKGRGKNRVYDVSDETRKRQSEARGEYLKKNRELYGSNYSVELRDKWSKQMKEWWAVESNKNKRVEQILKGLMKRPTLLEQKFIDIISKNNLPYKYVGDGSLIIGGKNPDFVNINGQKIVIELANTYFHDMENYFESRDKIFSVYGYRTLVIWEEKQMKNEKHVLNDIQKIEGGDYRAEYGNLWK